MSHCVAKCFSLFSSPWKFWIKLEAVASKWWTHLLSPEKHFCIYDLSFVVSATILQSALTAAGNGTQILPFCLAHIDIYSEIIRKYFTIMLTDSLLSLQIHSLCRRESWKNYFSHLGYMFLWHTHNLTKAIIWKSFALNHFPC